MTRFERIHVQGFKRLIDVDLELRPLNVLIGANGSGKTSLLEVFSLLAASASGGLSRGLFELGGLASLLSLDKARRMSFESLDDRAEIESDPLPFSDQSYGAGPRDRRGEADPAADVPSTAGP